MRSLRLISDTLHLTPKRLLTTLLLLWGTAYLASAVYQVYKPLPPGLNVATALRPVAEVAFLADRTYVNPQGQRVKQQQIFDEVIAMVNQAQRLIVIDMFLFNDFGSSTGQVNRPLSGQLTRALINKKKHTPAIHIVLITDPINSVYGGQSARQLTLLKGNGIEVIETNLKPLRASNPLWSGFWYLCCQWFDNNPSAGWLPNPLGPGQITLRSYFSLFNFKANHRKTLITDSPEGWQALVSSANPHDASSWHQNVAMKFTGQAALDLLQTEQAVAQLSDHEIPQVIAALPQPPRAGQPQLQILTESQIKTALLNSLGSAQAGDQIDIMMFYLSHRDIMAAIKQAHARKVRVRLILDPNEDAFGRKKNGIPNRQAALELQQAGVPVRWCQTHGEQCHSKMLLKTGATGHSELILGSANLTRRNLNNFNLESNVRLLAFHHTPAISQARHYLDENWHNLQGHGYTVDYADFADASRLKYWWYRLSEWSGLSTF